MSADVPDAAVSSQQVNWWEVHTFITPWFQAAGTYPMVGTPPWCALPDDDPRKWAALLDAAQHWALRVETCQQAECEASHAVSAAANWGAIAQHLADREQFYRQKPWLRRSAS